MARGVQRLFPWLVRLAVRLYVWAVMLRVKEVLRCQLKSVSQVMLEQRLRSNPIFTVDYQIVSPTYIPHNVCILGRN